MTRPWYPVRGAARARLRAILEAIQSGFVGATAYTCGFTDVFYSNRCSAAGWAHHQRTGARSELREGLSLPNIKAANCIEHVR